MASAMKTITFILLLLVAIGTAACNRFCRGSFPVSNPVLLEIKRGGKVVADSELRGVSLFWIGNEGKEYENTDSIALDDHVYYPPTGLDASGLNVKVDSTHPLFKSSSAASISAERNIKNFYIEYADKRVDTIFIDYQQVSGEDNHCTYTSNVFNEIKFRGNKVPIDSSLINQYQYFPVYIINK